MSKIKGQDFLDKLNRLKTTCKDQGFDESFAPSLTFSNSQIIANGKSRYMAIHMDHSLEQCKISFDSLHQVISKLNLEGEITLSHISDKITIKQRNKSKRVKVQLPVLVDDRTVRYISNPPDIAEMIPLPDDFRDAIKLCENSLPKDTTAPKYECYSIQTNRVISTDGARVSIYKLSDPISESFMLAINDGLVILEDKFTHYLIDDNYIDLMSHDAFLRINFIINDEFPDIDNVEFEAHGEVKVNRQELLNDLHSATLFSVGTHTANSSIHFNVSKTKYTIRSENEMGIIIAIGKLESDIQFTAQINPVFLLQSIEQITGSHVIIKVYVQTETSKRFMINENNYTFFFASYAG